jgi:hypothetical protein
LQRVTTIPARIPEADESSMKMRWPSIDELNAKAPPPDTYRYEYLNRSEVPALVAALRAWYPGIEVGSASCHLREAFYEENVCLNGQVDRDWLVVLIKKGVELTGMLSVERDLDSEVLYGRLGAISASHRGARLSRSFPLLAETLARTIGAGMVYGLATMAHPYMQATFERLGWQLSGIMSAFDKEMITPGYVRRVYEAIYVKVLAIDELRRPRTQDMTPAVKALFNLLYPGAALQEGELRSRTR